MKKRKMRGSSVFLTLVLVFLYIPVVLMVLYSFNAGDSDVRWEGFSLVWYRRMLEDTALMDALGTSLLLGLVSCAISAVIGTLGAIGLVNSRFRAKGVLSNVAILPMMIPEIIMGMAFLAYFSGLGLRLGFGALVLAHVSFCVPYIFIVVRGRLSGLDPALREAALDLGATERQVLWDVTIPLIAPAILSGTLLAFAMSLDDVVISSFLTGAELNTLPIKVYSQVKVGVKPEVNALCTVILLVTFLIVVAAGVLARYKGKRRVSL